MSARRGTCLLILLMSLSGCFWSQEAQGQDVPDGYELVEGESYAFFRPTEWEPLAAEFRNPAREGELAAPVADAHQGVRGTLTFTLDEANAASAEEEVAFVEAALARSREYERVELRSVDVRGADSAVMLEFTFTSSGEEQPRMRQYNLAVVDEGRYFGLGYAEPEEVFDQERALTVIGSLRLDG